LVQLIFAAKRRFPYSNAIPSNSYGFCSSGHKYIVFIFAVYVPSTRNSDAEKGGNVEKVGFERAIELTGKSLH
jgi:hypothetical protein